MIVDGISVEHLEIEVIGVAGIVISFGDRNVGTGWAAFIEHLRSWEIGCSLRIEDGPALLARLGCEQRHGENLADASQPLVRCYIAQNAVAHFSLVGQLPQNVWRQNGANGMGMWWHLKSPPDHCVCYLHRQQTAVSALCHRSNRESTLPASRHQWLTDGDAPRFR